MTDQKSDSLSVQFGGDHYKQMAIEPVEYIDANGIPYLEGSAIKYLSRHQAKNGAVDLKKAIHFAVIALERRYGVKTEFRFVDPVKECNVEKSPRCESKTTAEQIVKTIHPTAMIKHDYLGFTVVKKSNGMYIKMHSERELTLEDAWQAALDEIKSQSYELIPDGIYTERKQ